MITINKSLPTVVAAKNPVWVKGETDNHLIEEGQNQYIQLISNIKPIDGEVWTFQIDGRTFSFTWKDTPDQSGTEVSLNFTSSGMLTQIVDDYINQIPWFVYYNIYIDQVDIPGTGGYMNLWIRVDWRNAPLEFVSTSNGGNTVNTSNAESPIPRQAREDFRTILFLYGELLNPSLSNFRYNPIAEIDSNPTDDGAIGFNLSPALLQEVKFFKPDVFTNLNQCFGIATGQSLFFFFRMEEQYYDGESQVRAFPLQIFPQAPTANTKLSDHDGSYFVAIHSKMPLKEFSENTFTSDYVTSGPAKKFLTHRPRVSTIHPSEPVFLHYIQNESVEVGVHVTLYLADGSTDSAVLQQETQSIDDGEAVHFIRAGIGNNELLQTFIDGREVVRYEIKLVAYGWGGGGGSPQNFSEPFTFIVEDRDWQHINYLLFENPLGGLDTFRITGDVVITDETSGEIIHSAQKQLQSEEFYDMVNSIRQPGFAVFSGIRKSRAEIEWARDIKNSDNVYLLYQGKEYKVLVDKAEEEILKERDSVFSMNFKLKMAFYD